MSSFTGLVSFILLAVSARAVAFEARTKFATHRTRVLPRGIVLETYHPASTYETFGEGKTVPTSLQKSTLEGTTTAFVASELGVDVETISYTSGYDAESQTVSYVQQTHDGVELVNAVANVAFKDNKVIAFGASFVDTSDIASSTPSVDLDSVIAGVEEELAATYNGVNAIKYLPQADGSIALTHAIQVQNEEVNSWYEAYVDAHTGELLSVIDFVSDYTYTVTPLWKDAVTEGQETLVDPETSASPSGWVTSNTTAGNNVISYKSAQTNLSTMSSAGVFDYPYDTTQAPTVVGNVNAARVNAFYIANSFHDLLYTYGFTEAAFNFQTDNFGNGGAQGDRVLMSVQDASGTNNANFATPPDGRSGTCRMYVFTLTTPRRDGSLQNDIVVHELTHGVTNRMTGGGIATCLQTTQAGGMGEGWSDVVALWVLQRNTTVFDYTMGDWVLNSDAGVRNFPYSTSETVNPLRYSSLAELDEVHDIGEVWANMLYNVYAALVAEYGWSATAMTDSTSSEGNVVWLHLLIDALALQPCNPTFIQARTAWIQADANRYGGANACILWNAFASRGLGTGATAAFGDSSAVPDGC